MLENCEFYGGANSLLTENLGYQNAEAAKRKSNTLIFKLISFRVLQ